LTVEEKKRALSAELRQRGDYREYSDVSLEQVKPFLPEARIFIQTIKDYLNVQ